MANPYVVHTTGIGKDAIPFVSAWAGQARLVLAQRNVDGTSNEITAIPEILRLLDLDKCTGTIDAMEGSVGYLNLQERWKEFSGISMVRPNA